MPNQISQTHPLAILMATQPKIVQELAQSWEASGAAGFGIWVDGTPLDTWFTDGAVTDDPVTTAAVRTNGSAPAELRVYGLAGEDVAERLRADAKLLTCIAGHENELNAMTMELIETQDQLLALYQLSQSTRNQLNIDDLLSTFATEAARLVKAPATCALLVSEHPMEVAHYPEPILTQPMLMALFGQVQETGRYVLLQGESAVGLLPPHVESVLVKPVHIRGQIRAAIIAMNKADGFHSPDIKLLRVLADYAGTQIESALLYQESLSRTKMQTEMELAQNVQLRLLPQQLPQVAGVDIAAGTLPALQVGGDFYDCIDQPGEPFTFVVGDVTGKGMPAALLMMMSRTLIRSKAHSMSDISPANILGSANDDLYDDFTEVGMFATVFVGQYDHRERMLYYANAGHSPVIYCPIGGSAVLLEADGTPMGVLPVSLCENQALELRPGDVLVGATDGFSEASNQEGEMFGYERLLALVEGLAQESAQDIASGMFDAIAIFSSGHQQDDDQTLFVIKGV